MINDYTRRKLIEADPDISFIEGEILEEDLVRANLLCREEGLSDSEFCLLACALKRLGYREVSVGVDKATVSGVVYHVDIETQYHIWVWARYSGKLEFPLSFTLTEKS